MSASVLVEDGERSACPPPDRIGLLRALQCPACGSSNVAQVLGDNGGISYVCTACGHSWS